MKTILKTSCCKQSLIKTMFMKIRQLVVLELLLLNIIFDEPKTVTLTLKLRT